MNKIKQVIVDARANGVDPVTAVQDYLCEKDSRCSRAEAARIVTLNSGDDKPTCPECMQEYPYHKADCFFS